MSPDNSSLVNIQIYLLPFRMFPYPWCLYFPYDLTRYKVTDIINPSTRWNFLIWELMPFLVSGNVSAINFFNIAFHPVSFCNTSGTNTNRILELHTPLSMSLNFLLYCDFLEKSDYNILYYCPFPSLLIYSSLFHSA